MIERWGYILKSDSMSNGLGSIVRSVLRMLATISIARAMSVSGFGFYIALVTIETLCACIVNSLCTAAIPVLISGCKSRFSLLVISIAEQAQVGMTALVVIMSLPVLLFIDDQHHAPVCAFAFHMIALSWFNSRRGACTSRFRSRPLLFAELLVGLVPLIPLLITHRSSESMLSMYWTYSCLTLCFSSLMLKEKNTPKSVSRVRRIVLAGILVEGWKMTIGTIALTFQSRIQPLILGVILGSNGMGVYGAVNMFGAPIRMFGMAVRSISLPRLSARTRTNAEFSQLSHNLAALTMTILVTGLCCMPIAFITDPIVSITLGDGYDISHFALPIAVWSGMLALISTYMVCEAQSIRKTALTSTCRWASAGVSLVSTPPLTLVWGIPGACLSLAIGEIVMITLLSISLRRASCIAQQTTSTSFIKAHDRPTKPFVAHTTELTYI